MSRTENIALAVLCLIQKGDFYLLQDRVKEDWKGFTLPGGHVEKDESIVDAVIREMKEETGLTVLNPKLCGVRQFPIDNGRYVVFLFHTTDFCGEVASSDEGEMRWVNREDLHGKKTVSDFSELLKVILDDKLNEFQYVIEDNKWKVIIK